jgi:hypothetical protein
MGAECWFTLLLPAANGPLHQTVTHGKHRARRPCLGWTVFPPAHSIAHRGKCQLPTYFGHFELWWTSLQTNGFQSRAKDECKLPPNRATARRPYVRSSVELRIKQALRRGYLWRHGLPEACQHSCFQPYPPFPVGGTSDVSCIQSQLSTAPPRWGPTAPLPDCG